MGCFGTIASLLIVGFSFNFWMALFGRFLGGALNGNIGVIQTMVAELVTDPRHERECRTRLRLADMLIS
jgi:MFS family permease